MLRPSRILGFAIVATGSAVVAIAQGCEGETTSCPEGTVQVGDGCADECSDDDECGSGETCLDGHCQADGGGGSGGGGGGGSGGGAGTGGTGGGAGTGGTGGSAGTGGTGPTLCEPQALPCEDDLFLDLDLKDTASTRTVTNTAPDVATSWWETVIDARAGGAFPPLESYVYTKFIEGTGLVKINISDETALTSMDWDIAFRRFVIRLNSGSSGPSCVQAGRRPDGTTFEEVTEVPAGSVFFEDEFYTASCDLIPDGFGLGSPGTFMSGFWSYSSCLAMTGTIYLVELRNGRHVKLEVLEYYGSDQQAVCDGGGAPDTTSSAVIKVRWEYLD